MISRSAVEIPEQVPLTQGAIVYGIDAKIATITGYIPARISIPDEIDARISLVTGHSPAHVSASSWSSV
jgi:hypothetical protein